MRVSVTGLGSYLPERRVDNAELAPLLGVSPQWIEERSGIKARRYAAPEDSTASLGHEAAAQAMAQAGVGPEDLDLLVFATLSPDHEFPGSGFMLQERLGVGGFPVHDVRAQCSGFLYGLSVADRAIRCGDHRCVLLVGAETQSKGMDFSPEGRAVSMLFGDGAGACVLQPGEPGQLRALRLGADGRFAKSLWLPAPGSGLGTAQRLTGEMLEQGLHRAQMDGPSVFIHAIQRLSQVIEGTLAAEGLTVAQVDLFVLHQANIRILERVAQRLAIPEERLFHTIAELGNTTAASLPLGLHRAQQAGALRPGMRVVIATFGSGYTWGCGVLEW